MRLTRSRLEDAGRCVECGAESGGCVYVLLGAGRVVAVLCDGCLRALAAAAKLMHGQGGPPR